MRCPICSNLIGGGRCSCSLAARSSASIAAGQVQSDWNRRKISTETATQQFQQIRDSEWPRRR